MNKKIIGGLSMFLLGTTLGPMVTPGGFTNSSIHLNNSTSISYELERSSFLTEPKGEFTCMEYTGFSYGELEKVTIHIDNHTKDCEDTLNFGLGVRDANDELEQLHQPPSIIEFRGRVDVTYDFIERRPTDTYRKFNCTVIVDTMIFPSTYFRTFIVEYFDKETFKLNENFRYVSKGPKKVFNDQLGTRYYYETFSFNNLLNKNFDKPMFDVHQLTLDYSFFGKRFEIFNYSTVDLLIEDIFDGSDIEMEDDLYKIPLKVVYRNGSYSFDLVNPYYYDSSDGKIYSTDKKGRVEINNLVLPAMFKDVSKSFYYEIRFKDTGVDKNDYTFTSFANFNSRWFGNCSNSYYCVDCLNELLEDVHYEGGVEV